MASPGSVVGRLGSATSHCRFMPWSVNHPYKREVWDIYVPRRTRDIQMLPVWLINGLDPSRRVQIGSVMRVVQRCQVSPVWWASYLPEGSDPLSAHEHARGFATRRLAIEHILYRTGWRRTD